MGTSFPCFLVSLSFRNFIACKKRGYLLCHQLNLLGNNKALSGALLEAAIPAISSALITTCSAPLEIP